MKSKDRLIVALDVDSAGKALGIVDMLKNYAGAFKVGLELFTSAGPGIVGKIRQKGCGVFLDLKFHDIPNTAAKAARAVTGLEPDIFNVHALGSGAMMRKTAEAVKEEAARLGIVKPRVLAVTMLTSMDEQALKEIGLIDNMPSQVLRMAKLAKDSGLDGVVASAAEAAMIRGKIGRDFLIVTPGVRPSWAGSGDQKRVATPKEAIDAGADYIVVGRPILDSPDPVEAAKKILKEIKK